MKRVKARKGRGFGAVEKRRRELAERYDKLYRVPGPRSLRVPERGKRRLGQAHGGTHIHQRWRSRGGAPDARHRRSPVPYQQLHHGRRLSSASPDHHRRRLHRPEFAQMYRRFGSEVTIIETAARLAQHEDEDVSTAIREILEGEGIQVRLNATCIGFSRRGEDILAHVDCESGDREVSGSHLLLAVGRRPNTDDLGLTEAGVASTNEDTLWLTTSCGPASRESGR